MKPWKVLLGLVCGAASGAVANALWRDTIWLKGLITYVADPVGQIFLRMLFMIVIPLVFTSVTPGITGLGDLSRIGRIGTRTAGILLGTIGLGAMLGVIPATWLRPGDGFDPARRAELVSAYGSEDVITGGSVQGALSVRTITHIVPDNIFEAATRGDVLGIIFFSIVFGIALTRISPEARARVYARFRVSARWLP